MTVNIDSLFQKEAFRRVDPERRQLFQEFASQLEGKNPTEIVSLYMQYSQRLPKDKPLSKAEQDAIVETVFESLPDTERQKLSAVLKMMEMMKLSNSRG